MSKARIIGAPEYDVSLRLTEAEADDIREACEERAFSLAATIGELGEDRKLVVIEQTARLLALGRRINAAMEEEDE